MRVFFNNCRDKAISVGETSKLKGININVTNANFGIASKDNSITNIKTLNIKKVKYCLAAYNKKEFSGGKINIIKMNCNNYQQQTYLDKISEIKMKKID